MGATQLRMNKVGKATERKKRKVPRQQIRDDPKEETERGALLIQVGRKGRGNRAKGKDGKHDLSRSDFVNDYTNDGG